MEDSIKMNLNGAAQLDLNREGVERAYDRWAPVYDLVFGPVFGKGRRAAILATNRIGGRVLEVGVGTGISLPLYSANVEVFGVDISEAMLRKAQERVERLHLTNVEGLAVMDAEHLDFEDSSFDVVMAQYVVTAVPNPEACLDEFARVLKPGGELILLSRVSADAGLRHVIEKGLDAGRPSAWFSHRLRVVPLRRMGHRERRAWHGVRRAPCDSAARPLLPDPLSQGADASNARVADEQQSAHVVPIRHVNTKLSSAGN